jgi:uncharacterized OsmC-like protein
MTSKIVYTGDLRTHATHLSSGSEIDTDAPVDNHGKGARFSPTDLAATSLGACMMTVMGIAARERKINLVNTVISVEKMMAAAPRRIAEIKVTIRFPENSLDTATREYFERLARNCPVAKSLHPDILQTISFVW